MRINIYLFFLAVAYFVKPEFTFSQSMLFQWAKGIGGTNQEFGQHIGTDNAGNIYVTGNFKGTADFDPGPEVANQTANGLDNDVFITKLNSEGEYLWTKKVGGNVQNTGDIGMGLDFDANNNVYVTGYFQGQNVDFDPGDGVFNLNAMGGPDAFVLKLTSDGDFVWAKQLASNSNDAGATISVDDNGFVIVAGHFFSSSNDFNPGPGVAVLSSAGNYDVFVVKLTLDGDFVWAKSMGGSSSDSGIDLETDNAGNIYLAGNFQSNNFDADPGAGTVSYQTAGESDIIIAKWNANGEHVWSGKVGGAGLELLEGLTLDHQGNLYLTGAFSGQNIDFNISQQDISNLSSTGSWDIFILKLTEQGSFVWAKKVGGSSVERGMSIQTDGFQNVYVAGHFGSTVDFDPGAGTHYMHGNQDDVFVLKLDQNGSYLWAGEVGSTAVDLGISCSFNNGSLYVTGYFAGTVDFDPSGAVSNISSKGSDDVFVLKLGSRPFTTVWKTDNSGVSEDNQIQIPGTGNNYNIEWEEVGNEANNRGTDVGNNVTTLTFPQAGTYRVKLSGDFSRINFNDEGDKEKIVTVEQWGDVEWSSMASAFFGCRNLNVTAVDAPNLSSVTDMSYMFSGTSAFNGAIGHWNVSNVTDMSDMFNGANLFNQPINSWNTSAVIDMSRMFISALNFNQFIGNWNTANVTNMSGMFATAINFNQPLNDWNTSSVTDMSAMFFSAVVFNGEIGNWNTTNVTNMFSMFNGAVSFNAVISNWNTANVNDMRSMFAGANVFNQPIGNWNVSNVTGMSGMFQGAISFNQHVDNWNVSNVTTMEYMFHGTTSFNHDLGHLNITKVTNMTNMLSSSGLSKANYDATLQGWAAQNVQPNVNLGASGLEYCFGDAARQSLIDTHGWIFSNDTYDCTKEDQSISFEPIADRRFGDDDFSPEASATSELPVSFASSDVSVATINDGQINIVGTGTSTITATQGGNDYYNATEAQQTLTVYRGDQTISFVLENKIYGDDPFVITQTSTAGLPISYISSNPEVATIDGNVVSIVGAGSTTITASQPGDVNYNAAVPVEQLLVADKAEQSISFEAIDERIYGDNSFSISATSSTGLPITFTSSDPEVASVDGTIVTITGAGNATVTASQLGNINYNAATVEQLLVVNKADQTISFETIEDRTYGDNSFSVSATSSAGLPISFTSSNPEVATVDGSTILIVGAGNTLITASQPGNINYNTAPAIGNTLTIHRANQVITFNVLPSKTYADPDFEISATSSSALPLTFSSSDNEVATVNGNTVTIRGAGTTTITATQDGNTNFNAALPGTYVLTIDKAAQIINFPEVASRVLEGGPFSLNAVSASGSGIPVMLVSSDQNVLTITDGMIANPHAYGFVTVIASQNGSANYYPAERVIRSFCINPNKPGLEVDFTDSQNPVLISSTATDNRWYLNNVLIDGATDKTYHVVQPGSYQVRTESGDCKSEFSDAMEIIITGVGGSGLEQAINLFPNPVTDLLSVSGTNSHAKTYVYSATGVKQEVRSAWFENAAIWSIDTSSLSSGFYLLMVENEGHHQQMKFTKR